MLGASDIHVPGDEQRQIERSDRLMHIAKEILHLPRILRGKTPLKIRQKMTLIVLSTSIATLILLSGISFYGMVGARNMAIKSGNEIGEQANQNSSTLLEEQQKEELALIAVDKADDINQRLADLTKDVRMAASEVQKIHRNPQRFLPQELTLPPAEGDRRIIFYMQYGPDVDQQALAGEMALDANVQNLMMDLIERDPLIDSIFVTSPSNYTLSVDNNLATTPEEYEPSDLIYDAVSKDWYQLAVKNREVSFTPAREFVFSKKLGIFCAFPFYDESGALEGVSCLQTTLDDLDKLVKEVNLRNAGFCFVVDNLGRVILSSSPAASDPERDLSVDIKTDRRLSGNVPLAETITAMVSGQEGVAEVMIDGDRYYVAYAPVKQTGWSFAAAVEEKAVLAPVSENSENLQKVTAENLSAFDRHMIVTMLATAIFVLILLGALVFIGRRMSERFVAPLHILSDGVREIASGNLGKKIDIQTGDEVEHLAICFNAMTDNLKGYMDKLTVAALEKDRQNQLLRQKNEELSSALHAVKKMRISRDIYRAESETDQLTKAERICEDMCHDLSPGEEAALFIIDLDHFKEANDTFGHQYGDRILVEFAMQLKLICRPEDCLGRFGGDEFVVMITGALTRDAIINKARLIHEAARQLRIDEQTAAITASIGIAVAPIHGKDYQALFQAADNALYFVKEHGRDAFCIYPDDIRHQ